MPHRLIWIITCALLLAACSLSVEPSPPPTTLPATAPPVMLPATGSPVPSLLIHTDTGPYDNQTALLDGVCFEYLASHAPTTWTWDSPSDLVMFFDGVDASDLCPTPAARATFDFDDGILLAGVQTARGCDAAHIVTTDILTEAGAIVLHARLVVQPGCTYELVEPLVIAVPRHPETTPPTLTLETPP